jgi:hypothetical protein
MTERQFQKWYVSCGDYQLLVHDLDPWCAAIELVSRAMTNPTGVQMGPLVMASQCGFRSPENMDSETKVFNFFNVLSLLGHKFRPGGLTDRIFRSDFYDENETDE